MVTIASSSITGAKSVFVKENVKKFKLFSTRCSDQRLEKDFPAIGPAKRVVLVRHGQSTWNAEGRIQGSSNFSILTAKGESQAEISRRMLINDSFDVCFTSPLNRSKRTAEIIWADRHEEVIPEYELREIDLYSFQGLLKHEGKDKHGDAYWMWQRDAPNFSIDGHYPVRELWNRAKNSWSIILAHPGKSVLVVAHNAVNQALIASALGLGTDYFRRLLQSNCGVSVLDFIPQTYGAPPSVCLNRLNQTPDSPIAVEGRKTTKRIILVCHGATQSNNEVIFPNMGYEPMNMLGVIQAQKTAELLLDLKVHCIVSSPRIASVDTTTAITEVQEAADCLTADYTHRNVNMKKSLELEVEHILQEARLNSIQGLNDEQKINLWNQSSKAWKSLLQELSDETATDLGTETEKNIVAVGHPSINIALICQSLKLTKESLESFHLDFGSITVIDFPDGPEGKAVVRCTNYTAHLGRWSIPVTKSMELD